MLGYVTLIAWLTTIVVGLKMHGVKRLPVGIANAAHVTPGEREAFQVLGLYVIRKKVEGGTLTQLETALYNRINTAGQLILQNYANMRSLETAIDAGNVPNLDSGWQ